MPPGDSSGVSQESNAAENAGTPNAPTQAVLSTDAAEAPVAEPTQANSEPQSQPPLTATASPVAPQRGKGGVVIAIIIVAVLAAAGAGYWWWATQRNAPDKVFSSALSKMLSTSTITQTVSAGAVSGSIAYDGTNIKDPKVSVAATVKDSGLAYRLSGYGTLQNDYLKYTSFGGLIVDKAFNTVINKWISLRQDGKLQQDVDSDLESMTDPRGAVFGDLLIGNFSASQRRQLVDYINANKVYAYKTANVQTAAVHGKKVYVYPVTENVAKLKELNKKAAAMMGVKPADIQSTLDDIGTTGTTKFYIDVSSKEIVEYSTVADGETVSGGYTEYNTTSLPQEPKADMSWAEFEQKQADFSNLLGGGTTSDTSTDATQHA